jgi:hypothetical protein
VISVANANPESQRIDRLSVHVPLLELQISMAPKANVAA